MLLEGIFAPVTTPFYPDERIYFRKIEANMVRYSRSLLAGMVVLGSTGEAVALNDVETRDAATSFCALRRCHCAGKVHDAGVPGRVGAFAQH